MSSTASEKPGGPIVYTGTISSPSVVWTGPSTTSHTTIKTRPRARVVSPPALRVGGKRVLVAFLDEDDNQEWSAQVTCESATVDYDGRDTPTMTLTLILEDRSISR